MRRPGLRFDVAGAAEIDDNRAEELTACRRIPRDDDVNRADARFVPRDRGEEAVLGLGARLVADWRNEI
jgi:hypothetical protein